MIPLDEYNCALTKKTPEAKQAEAIDFLTRVLELCNGKLTVDDYQMEIKGIRAHFWRIKE